MTKTVLITGSSSGIGRCAAQLFAQKGWNVVATMRAPEKEQALYKLSNVLVTRLDVQDHNSISKAMEVGVARFGHIDLLVNNAGYGQYGLFEAIPRDKVQEQFDVNLFGVMDVTRAMLPHFRQIGGGMIINISSGAGMYTLPMISLYCASKFALEGFSEALSYELASQNVIVKLVVPHGGVTGTNFSGKAALNNSVSGALEEYDEFVGHTNKAFATMNAARTTTAEEVAKLIYDAATDGTDKLRYLIGDDARGFVRARRELPEEDYIKFIRSKFAKKTEKM